MGYLGWLLREAPTGRVLLAHSDAELPFAIEPGAMRVIVPHVDAHTMVVFEGS